MGSFLELFGQKSPKGPPGGPRGRNNFSKGALRVPPGGSRKFSRRLLEGLGSARAPSRNPIKIEVRSTFRPPGTAQATPAAPRKRFGGVPGRPRGPTRFPGGPPGEPQGGPGSDFGSFFEGSRFRVRLWSCRAPWGPAAVVPGLGRGIPDPW